MPRPSRSAKQLREQAVQGLSVSLKDMIMELSAASEAAGRSQNLQRSDYSCLSYLVERGSPASPKDLIAHLGLTSGAVTGIIDRLEKQGYVHRAPNPDDRRGTLVNLDSAKAASFITAFSAIHTGFEECTKTMSLHDLQVIDRFLGYVKDLATQSKQAIEHAS